MSYAEPETSIDKGEPYFLYLFDNGITQKRLTSEPNEVVRLGERWLPSPVAHADIEQTSNIEKNSVDLTFPLSDPFARSLTRPASEITTVTIWRGHRTDPDSEFRVCWKGRIITPKKAKQTIKVGVESVFTSLRRPGCRARYQRTCRHALYFAGCNLNLADKKIPATVTAMAGDLSLTVPEAALSADGEYKAGLVIFNGLFGWIGSHSGNSLILIGSINGLAEAVAASGSVAVEIAPGCDLSEARCAQLGNHLNHGGFKNLPNINPFTQGIV